MSTPVYPGRRRGTTKAQPASRAAALKAKGLTTAEIDDARLRRESERVGVSQAACVRLVLRGWPDTEAARGDRV